MKLGAQLFSVRTSLQTPEDTREAFRKIHAIGYENVQLSGNAQMDPHVLKDISEEFALPIVCSHSPYQRIVEETDTLIREHQIMGCPVIGLGMMPKEFRTGEDGLNRLFDALSDPVRRIHAAGLDFAYHNHALEFELKMNDGRPIFDEMIRRCTDWTFILDTYWVEFAGYSAIDYIAKIGGKRLANIHYKDMADDEARSICSCGAGILDFERITEACEKIGVQNVLVEQDNAVKAPDAFAEMASSFAYLRPMIH